MIPPVLVLFAIECVRRTPSGWRILMWGMWIAAIVALIQAAIEGRLL